MKFHLTNTEAAIGWILLAIGGILIIWWCSRPLGPKPQPREDFRPLFPLDEAPPARKPAVNEKVSKRKRDKRTGRYVK